MVNITNKEFNKLSAYIKSNYGINLKDEKRTLVTGRLHNVLLQNNFDNFTDYYEHILSDKTGNAATTLINKITTNHTYFMREARHFDYFRDYVLPHLEGNVKGKDLRIWSAGCSTGEEPYTLAMLIDEYFGKKKYLWDGKILATDISSKVLEEAKEGIYKKDRLEGLPSYWKLNYFKNYGKESSIIQDKIKNEIIFRRFNLMDKEFPFKRKFHVIFCRNVMIYFDEKTKENLINKFYNNMEIGGYLFVGHSESLDRKKTKFKYIQPAIYRKE